MSAKEATDLLGRYLKGFPAGIVDVSIDGREICNLKVEILSREQAEAFKKREKAIRGAENKYGN